MAAPAGEAGVRTAASDDWEVSDEGVPPMRLNTEQVLALIAQGRLGFDSQARRPGDAKWTRTASLGEFGFAFPHMNFLNWKNSGKYNEADGIAAINPSFDRATDLARKVAMGASSQEYAFWFSAHVDWIPAPIVRKAKLFKMWDGFWVSPLVESSTVRPGTWLNVYLVAFNFTNKTQQRTIRATDAPVPEETKGNLTFTVPSWRWTVQRISVPATQSPGEHKVGFTTRTGAERAATALAVGVLTLGTVIASPGASGFTLTYRILPPAVAKTVTDWEAWALQAAEKRFDAARAVAIADAAGREIPRETVLQRFRPYLTPSLVLAALEDKERGPQVAITSYFDDFIFDAFGVDGAEKAFVVK